MKKVYQRIDDDMKNIYCTFKIEVQIDFCFWHLIPSININLHSHEVEFEWLCLGLYASKTKNKYEEI